MIVTKNLNSDHHYTVYLQQWIFWSVWRWYPFIILPRIVGKVKSALLVMINHLCVLECFLTHWRYITNDPSHLLSRYWQLGNLQTPGVSNPNAMSVSWVQWWKIINWLECLLMLRGALLCLLLRISTVNKKVLSDPFKNKLFGFNYIRNSRNNYFGKGLVEIRLRRGACWSGGWVVLDIKDYKVLCPVNCCRRFDHLNDRNTPSIWTFQMFYVCKKQCVSHAYGNWNWAVGIASRFDWLINSFHFCFPQTFEVTKRSWDWISITDLKCIWMFCLVLDTTFGRLAALGVSDYCTVLVSFDIGSS